MKDHDFIFSDKNPSFFSDSAREYELSVYHPKTKETFSYFLLPAKSAFSFKTKQEMQIIQVFLDYGSHRMEIRQTDILRSAVKAYHLYKYFSQKDHPFVFKELRSFY